MVFVGCGGDPDPDPGTGNGEPEVVFSFKDDVLAGLTVGTTFADADAFDAVFEELGIVAAGDFGGQIIEVDGVKALQITANENWGVGIDFLHEVLEFRQGDKLTLTGTYVTAGTATSEPWFWDTPQVQFLLDITKDPVWTRTTTGAYTMTRTLSTGDVNQITDMTPGEHSENSQAVRIGGRAIGTVFTITDFIIERAGEGGEAEEIDVLDFAAFLQNVAVGPIADQAAVDSALGESGVVPAGNPDGTNVSFEVIQDGSVKKLKITFASDWAGLDLPMSSFNFAAGDVIFVKGELQIAGQILLNLDHGDWSPLDDWNPGVGAFEKDFTLTAANITAINAATPRNIRIRSNNTSAVLILEQVKITGQR